MREASYAKREHGASNVAKIYRPYDSTCCHAASEQSRVNGREVHRNSDSSQTHPDRVPITGNKPPRKRYPGAWKGIAQAGEVSTGSLTAQLEYARSRADQRDREMRIKQAPGTAVKLPRLNGELENQRISMNQHGVSHEEWINGQRALNGAESGDETP